MQPSAQHRIYLQAMGIDLYVCRSLEGNVGSVAGKCKLAILGDALRLNRYDRLRQDLIRALQLSATEIAWINSDDWRTAADKKSVINAPLYLVMGEHPTSWVGLNNEQTKIFDAPAIGELGHNTDEKRKLWRVLKTLLRELHLH